MTVMDNFCIVVSTYITREFIEQNSYMYVGYIISIKLHVVVFFFTFQVSPPLLQELGVQSSMLTEQLAPENP